MRTGSCCLTWLSACVVFGSVAHCWRTQGLDNDLSGMGQCVSGDLSGSICPVLGRMQKMTRVWSQHDLAGFLSDFSAESQTSPNTVGAKEWYHHHMVETGQSMGAHRYHVESGGIVFEGVPQNDAVDCLANSEIAEVGLVRLVAMLV